MQLTPISMKGEQMRTMSTNKLSAIVRTASPTPFSAVLPPATPTTVALSSHPPHRRTRPPLAMETCPSVKNILLLDSEGKRVAVKYYSDDWPTLSAKLAFEKSVFAKTQKANAGTEGNLHLIPLYGRSCFILMMTGLLCHGCV
uniref:Coatomer subunit zeta n=1 Tax=Setaria italica TaxID=4555 RepID=K3ZAK6_SETIT